MRTDEGISGWGEITSTTKPANRAVAGMLRQLNELLVGDDPTRIEVAWHKTFRAFTYMGSRGATSHVVSGIDIALWDIVGKARGLPIYETARRQGARRHPHLHPSRSEQVQDQGRRDRGDQRRSSIPVTPASSSIPFRSTSRRSGILHGYLDGELSKKGEREAAELTALIRETAGPDVEILIDAHGRFDVPTAIRLCRSLEDAGQIDWFEEPVPVESYHALEAGARAGQRGDLGRRAAAYPLGVRADPGEGARRLHHA